MANFTKKFKESNPNWKGGKIEVTCKCCGNFFETYPCRVKVEKGIYCSQKCANKDMFTGKPPWNKGISFNAKDRHWNWKGGVSDGDRLLRNKFRREIARLILRRDNYTCQICGARGVDMQIDHIQPWADYPELRFNTENCRTLCTKCHYRVTFNREMPAEVKNWGRNLSVITSN